MAKKTVDKTAVNKTVIDKAIVDKNITDKVNILVSELSLLYPNPKCSLNFNTPFELLIATILSAQCKDSRVNEITPTLFATFTDNSNGHNSKNGCSPTLLGNAELIEIETIIKSLGLYKNKALSIKSMAFDVATKFNSVVPNTIEELTTLRGVGRKTANVVMAECFSAVGITVDTHVSRLTHKIGVVSENAKTAEATERELLKVVPYGDNGSGWRDFSHYLVFYGRDVCTARNPKCNECILANICDSHNKKP